MVGRALRIVGQAGLLAGGLAAIALGGVRAAAAPGATPPLRWTPVKLAAHPPARSDHSLTVDTDRGLVYLYGGRRDGKPLDDLWAFDPKRSTWTELRIEGDEPRGRFAPITFYDPVRKRLIVTMGQGHFEFFNDVWAFDPATRTWTRLKAAEGDEPEKRYGAAGAHDLAGNRILVSHGFARGRFDDTWTFDLAAPGWRKVATRGRVPIKRCLLRGFYDPETRRMFIFGGQTDGTPFLGDFWSLDVAAGAWRERVQGRQPGARNLYAATFDRAGRRWYVFGGNTARGPVSDLWAYGVATDAWERVRVARGPAGRSGADMVVVGGRLFLFGGNDGSDELDDTWVLTLGAR